MTAETFAARPVVLVAFSTVTGAFRSGATVGSTTTGAVGSVGRALTEGASALVVVSGDAFDAASSVLGAVTWYTPRTPSATTTMATRPIRTRDRRGGFSSSSGLMIGVPLRLAASLRA